MSSTRKSKDPTAYHQSRYASSAVFEPGLVASMVAKRCSLLENPADRELIWWLHCLSHRECGLKKVAAILVENYGAHFGTREMARIGKAAGKNYTAAEVKEIRSKIPRRNRFHFALQGETPSEVWSGGPSPDDMPGNFLDSSRRLDLEEDYQLRVRVAEEAAEAREKAQANPASYSVADFLTLCHCKAREDGGDSLERCLHDLCLNGAKNFDAAAPWYFCNLISTLRNYYQEALSGAGRGVITTTLGREVQEVLEFTLECRKMTLIEGAARTGKSYAARAWCEQHPGQARFIEVPTGNDETGFLRALARGLGLGLFSQYKAGELRERVESVLLTGDLLICLDEAHRLWPEMNARYGFPKRVNWLMSMANQGVPICLVATPQFLSRQKAFDSHTGWNSAQFQGRLGDYKLLPEILPDEDLRAVCKALLPEVDPDSIENVLAYARSTDRYLAAIETIASRARFAASRAKRSEVSAKDIIQAIKRVAPSDAALNQRLAQLNPGQSRRKQQRAMPAAIETSQQRPPALAMETETEFRRSTQPTAELIED